MFNVQSKEIQFISSRGIRISLYLHLFIVGTGIAYGRSSPTTLVVIEKLRSRDKPVSFSYSVLSKDTYGLSLMSYPKDSLR